MYHNKYFTNITKGLAQSVKWSSDWRDMIMAILTVNKRQEFWSLFVMESIIMLAKLTFGVLALTGTFRFHEFTGICDERKRHVRILIIKYFNFESDRLRWFFNWQTNFSINFRVSRKLGFYVTKSTAIDFPINYESTTRFSKSIFFIFGRFYVLNLIWITPLGYQWCTPMDCFFDSQPIGTKFGRHFGKSIFCKLKNT